MAPARGRARGETSAESIRISITSGNSTERGNALDDCISLFTKRPQVANQATAEEKWYRSLLDALFHCAKLEKQAYYSNKKISKTPSLNRLAKTAETLRVVVNYKASSLSRASARKIVELAIETLRGSKNEEYVEPLLDDYVKTLVTVLRYPANVEGLGVTPGDSWLACVDFFVGAVRQFLVTQDRGLENSVRASPAPGSGRSLSLTFSTARSGAASTQRSASQISNRILEHLVQGLLALVASANVPLQERAKEISETILQVLRQQWIGVGGLHQAAFAALGCIIANIQGDNLALVQSLAGDVIPLTSHWWHARSSAAQSESLNAVREEILRTVFALQHHLEALIRESPDGPLLGHIEDVLDVLWQEYSKRDDRTRLQAGDLAFSIISTKYFSNQIVGLRPYDVPAERRWAVVEVIALLESIYSRMSTKPTPPGEPEAEQPRKRRRIEQHPDRLRDRLRSSDSGTKLTALQVIPFFLQRSIVPLEDLSTALADLTGMINDKRPIVASWAMIACASYTIQIEAKDAVISGLWKQIWQLTLRAISLPGTSRAACALLHAILEADLVSYHAIADDVTAIVTAADASGPALLVDSSLLLMLHLLHLRNTMLPNATQATCNHIIRWVFSRWKPADPTYLATSAAHVLPFDLLNLLNACFGGPFIEYTTQIVPFGGTISQSWKSHEEVDEMMRYLLLLPNPTSHRNGVTCVHSSGASTTSKFTDPASSNLAKKTILELLYPLLEEFQQLSETWTPRGTDPASLVSAERMQSLTSFCLVVSMLVPHLGSMNSSLSRDTESVLFSLVDNTCKALFLDPTQNENLLEICFSAIAAYIPQITTAKLEQLHKEHPALLKLFAKLSGAVRERHAAQSSGNPDTMDIDDDFESQNSQGIAVTKASSLPRHDVQLSLSSDAFYLGVAQRLHLLSILHEDPGQIGLLPEAFLDQLLALSDENFVLCRALLQEIVHSDLVITPDDALKVVETIGGILQGATCCEIVHGVCLDIMQGFVHTWNDDKLDISSKVGDLYWYYFQKGLPMNTLSPKAQVWLSNLLYRLLEVNPHYGSTLELPSCRSSLFSILHGGNMFVKYSIGLHLPDIFTLYTLPVHDGIFVDILENLPYQEGADEGIAFRLFALARLACKWPTLLRRCIYHIFETPGRLTMNNSTKYASRSLAEVSRALSLDSPRELFRLFTPQLLYTWLEHDSIQDVPFEIFDFKSLDELLAQAQEETTALLIMRGQEKEAQGIAQTLGLTLPNLIQNNFSKIMSYGFAQDITSKVKDATVESRVRKLLGKEPFMTSIYLNFADITATFFDLIDQENPIERYFERDPNLKYAAEIMTEIKSYGHSPVGLPPNQQPMFKAKLLTGQMERLCSRTHHEFSTLWTPAFVVSVARKLLNTIHSALGPLHACSVLRKLRVLLCLAGPQATSTYPLEMLLRSLRPFFQDAECADDAFGITKYLITRGTGYLATSPSFFAGYSLSALASLRMFLESSQASTTQESQFKATMNNAQLFHSWFAKYLLEYDSSAFKRDSQRASFNSITQSASQIRASGNADKGTPESTLLLEILKDGEHDDRLLDDSARDLVLGMLCGDFKVPVSSQNDVIETDQDALDYDAMIWKSCRAHSLNNEYLIWAGRVVGRSFAAAGEIDAEMLRESRLAQYVRTTSSDSSSEEGLLRLLETLTMSRDSLTASLSESAIRTVVTEAVAQEDNELRLACQNSLSEALLGSSDWQHYKTPPSDFSGIEDPIDANVFSLEQINLPSWSQRLAVHLSLSIPDDVVLSVLPPILRHVKGFAEQSFPFIVHLVLLLQIEKQQVAKRHLSEAAKDWLGTVEPTAQENVKLLVNTILYLRTQPLPNEFSIADRTRWLDLDLGLVASAATRCGMFKVALLFAETSLSETSRGSRRSSAAREMPLADSSHLLLSIFENIDDPDAYYGLPQHPSLANVMARLEYEKDGIKTLAFRGAQYDSHLRRHDRSSSKDGQPLVQALSNLGLSGLSHSLLATQQTSDTSTMSLDSTFINARRLGIWNLPTPFADENHAVTVYKAYQSIHQATDLKAVQQAVYDGIGSTMRYLTIHSLNASTFRRHLGALAALTELDDILNINDVSELDRMLAKFEVRSKWMMSGRYDDVSQILSCRETTMSTISQQSHLRGSMKISPAEARLVEIRGMLLSSSIYRYHHATQESLNLATSLADLVGSSEKLGLSVDAAIKMEVADSLWDHEEMIPSIRLLQTVDKDSTLKNQMVPVSRSDLLSKIGYQVSVARLETPGDIQKKYLEPALKELKGKSEGKEAGQVFHQFAMFCDEQLQNVDGLEDLARLQGLKKGKSDEVAQLKGLISSAKDTQTKNRYANPLSKAKQWLELDQQELRRVEQTRNEFVKLSLENYLLALHASDEHNNDALRFTALWLDRSSEDTTNDAVKKYLDKVPTRKFAPLMNQLTSRLQDQLTHFQRLLITLVYRICVDHPYHGMYQIWSGIKSRANSKDEVAVLRLKATEKVAAQLAKSTAAVSPIWVAIDKTSRHYVQLASERDTNRYKANQKVDLKDSKAGHALMLCLIKHQIPAPTMQIELAADKDYSKVPVMTKLEPKMSIASGISAPKIITAVGSDGSRFKQLVKGGNDDLRQDAIMEQVFAAVSSLLKLHRTTRQRNLGIRTYKVLPLTSTTGLIEFVSDTVALHEYLIPAHEKYYPKDLKGSHCRKEISNVQNKTIDTRISMYRKVTEKFHPVMRYFFMEYFPDPDDWFVKRLAYTRTTAAISMLGHVLGLGDRHGHNILLDTKTGEAVHIDLGVAFEMGRVLPVPELVPFRLTRDIVDGMGITGTEGVFRRCCEFTLDAMREDTYSIMTILDVLRYDPLYSWSISPVRLAKLQDTRRAEDPESRDEQSEAENRKVVNEPSEADRALEVVRKKLSKTLSVTATVNDLINQATDERNLAVLYSGWAAYA